MLYTKSLLTFMHIHYAAKLFLFPLVLALLALAEWFGASC